VTFDGELISNFVAIAEATTAAMLSAAAWTEPSALSSPFATPYPAAAPAFRPALPIAPAMPSMTPGQAAAAPLIRPQRPRLSPESCEVDV